MSEDEFPWPEGTLVMARTPSGLPLRTSCANHIFQTIGPPKPVADYTESGYEIAVKCLVCYYATPPLDAIFFMKRADGMDMAGLFGELHAQIEGLHEAMDNIGKRMTGEPVAALRNFD
jgi:hypothetical protein